MESSASFLRQFFHRRTLHSGEIRSRRPVFILRDAGKDPRVRSRRNGRYAEGGKTSREDHWRKASVEK